MGLLETGYYDTIGSYLINMGGQFFDALLSIYFSHNFFSGEQETAAGRRCWKGAAAAMFLLTMLGDRLSQNNINVWMFLLFALPFFYTFFFEKGVFWIKLVICALPFVILVSLERIGVLGIVLIHQLRPLSYPFFLFLYSIRRFGLKLVLLLAVRFLLNHSIYDNYQQQRLWYALGSICAIDFAVLCLSRSLWTGPQSMILVFFIGVFCLFVPILFYYIVYLTGINLKQVQLAVSQKTYLDMQEQHMAQLMELQESLRKFKHDYKTHLFCIDHLVLEKNYEELHLYLQKIHGQENRYDHFKNYTQDNRINLILNQITDFAASRQVNLTVTAGGVKIEYIPLYDLNMLLSNLCTNAIEAAQKTQERKVSVLLEKNRAYLQIVVKNSVEENPLTKNPRFLTSKEDKRTHGLGMQIIRSIIEKYQGMIQIDGTDEHLKINVLLMDEA